MKQTLGHAPIDGPGLLPLVEAYLRLAPAPGDASSTVKVSRVFEWRTEGMRHVRGWPLLPVATPDYGTGVQRLSSGSAGITKASPKE